MAVIIKPPNHHTDAPPAKRMRLRNTYSTVSPVNQSRAATIRPATPMKKAILAKVLRTFAIVSTLRVA